jgi:hypothetical protein
VLPVHIIRNLIGLRDPRGIGELPLCPNLPDRFMLPGKVYRIRNLQYLGARLDLRFRVLDSERLELEGTWSAEMRTSLVKDASGRAVRLETSGSEWRFEANNHRQYFLDVKST